MESRMLFQRNIFECYLCGVIVTKPKALPCLHSFCVECLSIYISANAIDATKTFPCPQCLRNIKPKDTSKPIQEWAALFPDNIFLLNLLNNSKIRSLLNITNESNIMKKKPFSKIAYFNCPSLRKKGKISDFYTKQSVSSQYITKSVTYSTKSAKTIVESTPCNKKHFQFESKRNTDISYTRIFRSNRKPMLDNRVSETHFKNYFVNKPNPVEKGTNVKQDIKCKSNVSNDCQSNSNMNKNSKEVHAELFDGFKCTIPGIEITSEPSNILVTADGCILVADPKNKNIKKFSQEGLLLDLYKLNSAPSDITLISTTQIAISFFLSFELCFFTLSKPFKVTGRLSVPKQYQKLSRGVGWTLVGLSMKPGGLATLDVFSFTGEIINSLIVHVKGECAYLTTSPHGDILISSCKDKILSCYDVNGALKFLYFNTDQAAVIDPKGLCIDPDGFIYLADGKVSKIHRLKPDGTYDCEFLSAFDGIDRPAVMCMDKTGYKLIAAQSNGEIKMFIRHPHVKINK
ncbi:uncharacterized protein LOC128247800 [Octopus bimaculoides]|nr:uncharacterized protein LOC128247800 [Octopus bimaculoides]